MGGGQSRFSDLGHRMSLAPHSAYSLLVISLLILSQNPALDETCSQGLVVHLPGLRS